MEKIKQALEQAKRERDGVAAEQHAQSAPVQKTETTNQSTSGKIEYTQTQILPGSSDLMHEHRLISSMQDGHYTEAIKIMGTQVLQRMEENNWTSIAVTSPRMAAGKTTMAINLGLSIARQVEYTVLLVDANLRDGNVHKYFGLQPEGGLSNYLAGDTELSDVLVNPQGVDHFVILPAGQPTAHSAELLRSPRMSNLASELTSRYPKRVIVFDVPSVLDTAETLSLVPCVDSVLIVVEDDETKQSDLRSSVDMLSTTNIVGTVLNKAEFL